MQQINSYNKQYFEFAKYLGWILLFIFLWLRGCSDAPCVAETKIVKVPELKGKFEVVKPLNVPIIANSPQLKKGQILSKNSKQSNSIDLEKENYISELEKENEQLSRAYYFANDSVKKLMFEKSNQLNKFSHTFEDALTKIDISGISRGTVESIGLNYTIKKREINFKPKEVKFRAFIGGGLGLNKDLNQGLYKINLGFQNKKGNVLRGSYMKINNQDFGLIEYDLSLFKIQK